MFLSTTRTPHVIGLISKTLVMANQHFYSHSRHSPPEQKYNNIKHTLTERLFGCRQAQSWDSLFERTSWRIPTVGSKATLDELGSKQAESYKLTFIDISGAHLYSPSRRRVFVELLAERERSCKSGLIITNMLGTRDAVVNFASVVKDTLTNLKFEVGKLDLCLCNQASMHIILFHHGDDYDPGG